VEEVLYPALEDSGWVGDWRGQRRAYCAVELQPFTPLVVLTRMEKLLTAYSTA
jgi:hypothetical protein